MIIHTLGSSTSAKYNVCVRASQTGDCPRVVTLWSTVKTVGVPALPVPMLGCAVDTLVVLVWALTSLAGRPTHVHGVVRAREVLAEKEREHEERVEMHVGRWPQC